MSQNRSISAIRAALSGDGARPNLFNVELAFPPAAQNAIALANFSFMAEATSIPADKIGEIKVGYMGRETYIPGDREFDPWTITVINDENYGVRAAFENWMSLINSHNGNTRSASVGTTLSGYGANGTIYQLGKVDTGSAIAAYQMQGAFPTEIGAIELTWEGNNSIEKFSVTLRYQLWDAINSTGPTTDGGSSISLAG